MSPTKGRCGFYGEPYETERRNRVRLALWAYAYEFEDDPLVADAEFDVLAAKIRPEVETGFPKLDNFFQTEFVAHTGQWVRGHPELRRLAALYHRIKEMEKGQ